MRCAFMPAVGAVSMFVTVPFALVIGCAAVRVGAANGNGVLIDVIAMDVMQVTIMEIIGVPVVAYRRMPATRTMHVTMG